MNTCPLCRRMTGEENAGIGHRPCGACTQIFGFRRARPSWELFECDRRMTAAAEESDRV